MNETSGKINTIAEAIITAISEGHDKPTADSPAAEAYNRLKVHIENEYGNDSDLFRAVLKLELDSESKNRRGMVWEELRDASVKDDDKLFKLALNLKEFLQPVQPQKPTIRPINVQSSKIGAIAHKLKVSGGIHLKADDEKDWEKIYLSNLIENCDSLDLAQTEETCETSGLMDKLPPIRVSDVFTTLYLKYPERWSGQSVIDAIRQRDQVGYIRAEGEERIPIQAVEAVNSVPRMVLLGRPGGGKSTLVNYVVSQLARRRLSEQKIEDSLSAWPLEDKPLPVRIILRQMAAWINDTVKIGNPGLVWKYIEHMLEELGVPEFFSLCKWILNEKGGIIFFDGLDEVGEAEEARKRTIILQAVKDFSKPLKKCRVIVTCREYAYQEKKSVAGVDWRLPEADFPVTELDLFRDEQIQSFSRSWYRITGKRKGWNTEKCDLEADTLCNAILSMPNLKSLGENPLLLTLIAQVHGRLGYLPKDRADLYEKVVKLLLAHWENRLVRDVNGTCHMEQWGVMRLGVTVDTLREPLEKVAFDAHEKQEKMAKDEFSCADIYREDLRTELAAKLNNDLNKAEEFIEYIENRAGLLRAEGEDNRIFRFPHRTFQEYLTATGIMRTSNFEDVLVERLRRAPSWWQEVFLLAAGSTRNTPHNIYQLLDALLAEDPNPENLTPENVLMAQIAARAIYEADFMVRVKEEIRSSSTGRYSKIHRRIQKWLLDAMTADDILIPQQRCDAGSALNWVEDPRFNPDKWFLPNDKNFGFIEIPAGPFKMGSDKAKDSQANIEEFPQHTVFLSAYAIAKSPVTVAQYRVFAEETERKLDDKWQTYNPYDNHPVRDVNWHDAMAYCEWLTGKLNTDGIDCVISLPTEAQWEKAARGDDGRIYPWGDDKINPNKANYDETQINMTSPVGCFPGGKSPYDILDMSGNVWEWCRDRFAQYSKSPEKDPLGPDDGAIRIMRGGSWYFGAGFCRSANRFGDDPVGRFSHDGFRLVRLPGQPCEPGR